MTVYPVAKKKLDPYNLMSTCIACALCHNILFTGFLGDCWPFTTKEFKGGLHEMAPLYMWEYINIYGPL